MMMKATTSEAFGVHIPLSKLCSFQHSINVRFHQLCGLWFIYLLCVVFSDDVTAARHF